MTSQKLFFWNKGFRSVVLNDLYESCYWAADLIPKYEHNWVESKGMCVMEYFWCGGGRNSKLITLGSLSGYVPFSKAKCGSRRIAGGEGGRGGGGAFPDWTFCNCMRFDKYIRGQLPCSPLFTPRVGHLKRMMPPIPAGRWLTGCARFRVLLWSWDLPLEKRESWSLTNCCHLKSTIGDHWPSLKSVSKNPWKQL